MSGCKDCEQKVTGTIAAEMQLVEVLIVDRIDLLERLSTDYETELFSQELKLLYDLRLRLAQA